MMLTLVDDRTRHSELLNRLNTMRKSKAFCDVTIIVDNKEFLAHRVILASSSDYFLSKFTENSKCDRLSLDMNREIFNLLLNYFYTSNLYVPKELVPGLFVAAKYLKVRRVVKGCSQYLASNLSIENVMNVREAVSLNNSEQLCHSANEFIKEQMDKIMSGSTTIKLNMDIIVEAVPKKESDFHLSELVVDWLEYAIIDGNMTLADFVNENFVLFLTKSNSLVQYNEISSHKFPSTFLKDYFNKYSTNQKNVSKLVKSRARSKERPARKSCNNATNLNKTKFEQSDVTLKSEDGVIMISSDDPNGADSSESDGQRNSTELRNSLLSDLSQDYEVNVDENAVFLNCEDVDSTIDDDDLISNSIRSKMSAKPEEESCVISVNSTENSENECYCLKINCVAKVHGKIVCLSLHVKSVYEILNHGFNVGDNSSEMSTFYGLHKYSQSTTNGSESTTSGLSSSSVSAASSMLHVDCISALNANDDVSDTSGNEMKSEHDQSTAIQQFLKTVQNKVTSLQPCASLSTPRCAAGLVHVDDELMAIGGFNRGECLNSVEIYQPYINKWSASIPMSTCRARLVALSLIEQDNTSVFAIGGSDGYKELSTVERFDFRNQSWSKVASLRQARSYHGGCVLPNENGGLPMCVVVGGSCGPNSLRCCEIYDSASDVWSNLTQMKMARSQAAVSSIDQRIFVVGGTDSWKCVSSGESMDLREGKWHTLPELSSPRRGAALVSHGGKLYLFGGSDGQSSLRTLEIFDPVSNQWSISGSQMKHLRANLCGGELFNKLVAIGGFTGKHFLDTIECIDFNESSDSTTEWSLFVPADWLSSATDGVLCNELSVTECQDTITSSTNRQLYKQLVTL